MKKLFENVDGNTFKVVSEMEGPQLPHQDALRSNADQLQKLLKTRGKDAAWFGLFTMVKKGEVDYKGFKALAKTIPSMEWHTGGTTSYTA
jgi:hypothetical protein